MQCITASKKKLTLMTKDRKRGGEGCIYRVAGRSKLVAKIYHDGKATDEKRRKLEAMLENPPKRLPSAHNLAWPKEILFNETGQFIGFTMIAAPEGSDVLAAYTHKERRKNNHPNTTRRSLYKMAINICYTLEAVHKQGHLIGDFNPNNILCRDNGDVTLIDTDSFTIQAKLLAYRYPCEVGMADYLAPEIQSKSLSKISWNKEHDYFALAVHLFQTLLNNRHPFTATPAIGIAPAEYAVKLIAKGCYPHVRNRETQPDDITDILPPKIQKAFRQTFHEGFRQRKRRYTPQQWIALLKRELKSLKQCHACPEQYEARAPHCPYCGTKPVDRKTHFRETIRKQISRLKLVPAVAFRPIMKAVTSRSSRHPQKTVLPKAPVSIRKRIVLTSLAMFAVTIATSYFMREKSKPRGYAPTLSSHSDGRPVPIAPIPIIQERTPAPSITPEQEFRQLLAMLQRLGVSGKQSAIRQSSDGKWRFEYQSQSYPHSQDAHAEFEQVKQRIEHLFTHRGKFREVPIAELHEHFTTGCHFRSNTQSILLVIERYTDKHRVVLIAQ